jgi:rubrerythrin
MAEKIDVKEAIRRSMQTEKNAMDFYTRVAAECKNEKARKVFETLAKEERDHAHTFFDVYPGDDVGEFEQFIATDADQDSDWMSELDKVTIGQLNEKKAMELAMEKEQKLEKSLRAMAEKVDDPEVRKVFEDNARSTHNHYVLIESEYAHIMGMVHETDIDTFVRE